MLNNQEPILPDDDSKPDGMFLDEGTEEDWEEYDKKENKGWGGFINKVFNLNKEDETNSK